MNTTVQGADLRSSLHTHYPAGVTMSIKVVFGSDLGTTRAIATRIATALNAIPLEITKAQAKDLESCDLLLLGSPTYGIGELQCDWEERLDTLYRADLTGKTVALFGTGDQVGFADSFADAIGVLYDIVTEKGAQVIGFTDAFDYEFAESRAFRDGQFVGLVIDQDNQPDMTEQRIAQWLKSLHSESGLEAVLQTGS